MKVKRDIDYIKIDILTFSTELAIGSITIQHAGLISSMCSAELLLDLYTSCYVWVITGAQNLFLIEKRHMQH